MARKKRGGDGGGESWMNTYADMVTLLLTFFIMLFSMSSVEEEKWEMLIQAFTNRGNETSQVVVTPIGNGKDMAANQGEAPLPADGDNIDTSTQLPSDFNELLDYLQAMIEEKDLEGSVEVSEGEGMIYIQFQDNIFFNPDRFELRAEAHPVLQDLGEAIRNVMDQILVIDISGHTADVNIENYPVSDWMLSGERAASVTIFLEEQVGLDPTKMINIGYGKSRPVADNATPEGREKNRRVDMMIVSNEATPDAEELLKSILSGTYDDSLYPKSGSLGDLLGQAASGGEAASSAPETPPEEPAPTESAPAAESQPPAEEGAAAPVTEAPQSPPPESAAEPPATVPAPENPA